MVADVSAASLRGFKTRSRWLRAVGASFKAQVKYEEVYLKDYRTAWEAEDSLTNYFHFYCHDRIHQSLGYRTPMEVYRAS